MKKAAGYLVTAFISFILGITLSGIVGFHYFNKHFYGDFANNGIIRIYQLNKIREGKVESTIFSMESDIDSYACGLLYGEEQKNDYSKLSKRFEKLKLFRVFHGREFIKKMREYRIKYPRKKGETGTNNPYGIDIDKMIERAAAALE